MPRSPSGIYTLPEPLFELNTTIESADFNSDLSDIANELTNSINTAGTKAMTAPIRLVNNVVRNSIEFGSSDVALGAIDDATPEVFGFKRASDGFVLGAFHSSTFESDWNGDQFFDGNLVTAQQIATFNSMIITTQATYQGRKITALNSGTLALFFDGAAPTEWTIANVHDFVMRIVSGAGGGVVGGSSFSAIFSQFNSSFTAPDNGSHSHDIFVDDNAVVVNTPVAAANTDATLNSSVSGSTTNHTHVFDTRVFFMDMILCVKN